MMKNPCLFTKNVTSEQALEVMDYLYCNYIDDITIFSDYIMWYRRGELVAKWTNEYKNIMISKDFLDFVSADRNIF